MAFVQNLRSTCFALLALGLGAGFASSASAVTVDCGAVGGDCIGGIYTLDVAQTGSDTYVATYTIDTSVAFSVAATQLVDINIKVANDYSKVTFLSGPVALLGDGPLTGFGCGGGNDSFICADVSPDLAVGGVYTWEIQFQSAGLISQSEWHVGARYTGEGRNRGWVISETGGNPVPEPSAALIFGFGMVVAGSVVRRSSRRD